MIVHECMLCIQHVCVCVDVIVLVYDNVFFYPHDLQLLLKVSEKGDMETVSSLLDQGMDTNIADEV